MPECPSGYRVNDILNICEECNPGCAKCQEDKEVCEACDASLGRPYIDLTSGNCYGPLECPPGTYQSEKSLSCEPCANDCLTCLAQDICLSCNPGSFFLVDQCLPECPATSIKFDSATRQECSTCLEPCFTCEGTTDFCLTCITGFYFHENTCVSECPSGFKVDDA